MRKTLAAAAVAASLIGGGAAGAALFAPNLAGAQQAQEQQEDQSQTQQQDRPDPKQFIRESLQGLVDAGTITSEQADAVADALAQAGPPGGHRGGHGRGHHGPPLEAAAAAIGIDVETLRTELESGKTLAQVANDHGVATETLVNALVAELEKRLAEDVSSGRITQEQADAKKADAAARITEMVNSQPPAPGEHGPRGFGPPPEGSADQQAPSDTTQPSRSGSNGSVRSL